MMQRWLIAFFYFVQVFVTKYVYTEELSKIKVSNIRRIAEGLKETINENMDPCVNYMDYICGEIDNKRKMSMSELVLQRMHDSEVVEEVIKKFFPTSNLLEAEVKMANFVLSCQNSSIQDPMDILKRYEFFPSIKSWPAFDSNWSVEKFDFSRLFGELRSLNFLLGVDVHFIKHEGKRIMHISPEVIRENTDMEKTIWRINTLRHLGVEVAERVVGDVEVFEKVFANSMNVPQSLRSLKIETNFRRLKNKIPEMDWEKFFEVATSVIPDDTFPVIIENIRGVRTAIATVTNMHPRIIANYVFYQFMMRTYTYTIQHMGLEGCYDFTFFGFSKVITRLLANNYFSGEYNKYFFDAMNALIETLNESVNIFEISDEDAEEKLDKVLFEIIFPSLTGESLNKKYEDVIIDPSDNLGNLFRLYRQAIREWLVKAIKTKEPKMEIVNEQFISYVLVRSLYEFDTKPAALLFDSIAGPVISEAAHWVRTPEVTKKLNDSLPNCKLKRLEIFLSNLSSTVMIPVYRSRLYMDAYNKWAEKYKDMIEEEDEILKEFGLSNKKLLFAQMRGEAMCAPGLHQNDEITEHLKGLRDFLDEFQCPDRLFVNEVETC